MDFELDYERERELEGMIIEIDGLEIEVPENLIQEKMNLIEKSREYVINRYKEKAIVYKNCLLKNNKYSDDTFEQEFLEYLDDELDIFRPNNMFRFDPMAGFYSEEDRKR